MRRIILRILRILRILMRPAATGAAAGGKHAEGVENNCYGLFKNRSRSR